jgi:hypothetical protein
MLTQLRLVRLSSLLAISVVALAISLSNTTATSARAVSLRESPGSANSSVSLTSAPPLRGWLALPRDGDYARTQKDPELALGSAAHESFTVEGWFLLGKSLTGSGWYHFMSSASYGLGWQYSIWPKNVDEIFFHWTASCSGYNCDQNCVASKAIGWEVSDRLRRVSEPDCICVLGTSRWSPFPPGGWHYLAGVFDKTAEMASLYIDGNRVASQSASTLVAIASDSSTVGNPFAYSAARGADEVRISDIARYSTDFRPPTIPFACDEHTRALWHFDEVVGSTVFHDACGTVDNVLEGYGGAHTEGVTGSRVYLSLVGG